MTDLESESTVNATIRDSNLGIPRDYNRKSYDDPIARRDTHDRAFGENKTTRDQMGEVVHHNHQAAKNKYGSAQASFHQAEADHKDPLKNIHTRSNDNLFMKAFLKEGDIKEVGNRASNLQILNKHENASKGSSSELRRGIENANVSRVIRGAKTQVETDVLLTGRAVKNAGELAITSGRSAGINSAEYAAMVSGIYNIASCISGDKNIGDAIKDVSKDSTKAFAFGSAQGAGVTVVNQVLVSSESKLLMALGENNVAGKTITTIAVTGETVVKWGNGEISTSECLVELGNKGCSFGGAKAGAIVGQAVIPIPIVGAAVGSIIGGAMADGVYNAVREGIESSVEKERQRQQEIYEAMMRYYNEQQRRKEVQYLLKVNTEKAVINSLQTIVQSCEFQNLMRASASYFEDCARMEQLIAENILITLQLQEYHKQLEAYIENYFKGYEYCFSEALALMEDSLRVGNYNDAIAGTNQVVKLFGKAPVVENTKDFRKKIFGDGNISF